MPIFEYRCEACLELEEVLQKFDDPPPGACSACGKRGKMTREVSLSSFQLKGGGWYKDLYSSTPKDKGSSDAAAADGKKSDGGAQPVKKAKDGAATKTTTKSTKDSTPAKKSKKTAA